MDKAIITVLLIIAGVTCVAVMFNSILPAINQGSDAVVSMASKVDDRIKSQISIVHAANESNRLTIYIWIKNVGTSRIVGMADCDVFFGQEGDFERVPHEDYATGYPRWAFDIEEDDEDIDWKPAETMKITITYTSDPGTGTYFVKVLAPNGISDEYYFSM